MGSGRRRNAYCPHCGVPFGLDVESIQGKCPDCTRDIQAASSLKRYWKKRGAKLSTVRIEPRVFTRRRRPAHSESLATSASEMDRISAEIRDLKQATAAAMPHELPRTCCFCDCGVLWMGNADEVIPDVERCGRCKNQSEWRPRYKAGRGLE